MNRARILAYFFVIMSLGALSCVKHDVSFSARSEIGKDGSIERTGSIEIRISGERDASQDSLAMEVFYADNYIVPDWNYFDVTSDYHDSVHVISWKGIISPDSLPISDYIHKSKDGPMAVNTISVERKNRWIYSDLLYSETYSDPVDTARYFPEIRSQLSMASDAVLKYKALAGIRDHDDATELLDHMETIAGLDLFRAIIDNPEAYDTVSTVYEDCVSSIADSLAGFAGVKQNPDSLGRLIHDTFDAAWDTLLSDHPGLFGSFPFDDIDEHNFKVEVTAPGCILSTNADTTIEATMTWNFNRMDFFAKEYKIELSARNWHWFNIALSVIVLAIILFIILGPVRKRNET